MVFFLSWGKKCNVTRLKNKKELCYNRDEPDKKFVLWYYLFVSYKK